MPASRGFLAVSGGLNSAHGSASVPKPAHGQRSCEVHRHGEGGGSGLPPRRRHAGRGVQTGVVCSRMHGSLSEAVTSNSSGADYHMRLNHGQSFRHRRT